MIIDMFKRQIYIDGPVTRSYQREIDDRRVKHELHKDSQNRPDDGSVGTEIMMRNYIAQ